MNSLLSFILRIRIHREWVFFLIYIVYSFHRAYALTWHLLSSYLNYAYEFTSIIQFPPVDHTEISTLDRNLKFQFLHFITGKPELVEFL